jgi:hypothetical protein
MPQSSQLSLKIFGILLFLSSSFKALAQKSHLLSPIDSTVFFDDTDFCVAFLESFDYRNEIWRSAEDFYKNYFLSKEISPLKKISYILMTDLSALAAQSKMASYYHSCLKSKDFSMKNFFTFDFLTEKGFIFVYKDFYFFELGLPIKADYYDELNRTSTHFKTLVQTKFSWTSFKLLKYFLHFESSSTQLKILNFIIGLSLSELENRNKQTHINYFQSLPFFTIKYHQFYQLVKIPKTKKQTELAHLLLTYPFKTKKNLLSVDYDQKIEFYNTTPSYLYKISGSLCSVLFNALNHWVQHHLTLSTPSLRAGIHVGLNLTKENLLWHLENQLFTPFFLPPQQKLMAFTKEETIYFALVKNK